MKEPCPSTQKRVLLRKELGCLAAQPEAISAKATPKLKRMFIRPFLLIFDMPFD